MPLSAASSRARRTLTLYALSVLPLLFAAHLPLHADPTPATVVIGGREVPFSVPPFVGGDGQVYAPVDAVRIMGADFSVNGPQFRVTVTGVNGEQITVPYIPQHGHECVALQRVASALGASTDWQPSTATLTIRAKLEMVRQTPASLSIYTSYPVSYQVQHIGSPSRVYVDVFGLDLAAAPAAVPVADQNEPGNNVLRIRSGQINPNTVRITIDLKQDIPFDVASTTQSDHIRVNLGTAGHPAPVVIAQKPVAGPPLGVSLPPLPVAVPGRGVRPSPPNTVVAANPVLTRPAAPSSVRITGVSVKSISDSLTQIAVTASGQARYRTETLNNPNRLAFDLAGASVDAAVNPALPGAGPVIKAVRAGILHTGVVQFGRIVVDLSRLVAYNINRQVAEDGSVTYLINLQTPRPAVSPSAPVAESPHNDLGNPNSLEGKVVVIDPGHGLQDTGAQAPDGSCEKDLVLAIGHKLRDVLTQNGATVYMTRADNSFLPVMARPRVAVLHTADFFISVHCDSSERGNNTLSGTTVYFHAQNGLCRQMATDIVNRVSEVSGLPANGVKSDTIRFQTGFGVLRGSPMPAVLVECGYMNNESDLAKLKDDATQERIAEGITAGLRDFVADRSAR